MLRSFLARELVAFAQAHPGIEIDVDASHGYSDLARREADVAVRMSDDVEGDLVARRVIRYRKAVYASSLHIGAATDGVLDPAVHNWIGWGDGSSEEHTSALQSLMRISYAGLCLKKKNKK